MICFRCWRELNEVQSRFCGDTICSSDDGIATGVQEYCGCSSRNLPVWFLESISTEVFGTPGMCEAMMMILNSAWKNHKYLIRYITIRSLKNLCLWLLLGSSFHTEIVCSCQQRGSNGTAKHNGYHFFCHNIHFFPFQKGGCNQWWSKHALHPQCPDASVWIWWLKEPWSCMQVF